MRKLALATLATFALISLSAKFANAQEWLLNAGASRFYMQTAKANAIVENQRFTGLDGRIGKDGDARVDIDLISVKSGIDVRDVRMRFLLFETYKFPKAEITAKLDMAKLQALVSDVRILYPLHFKLDLHGMQHEFDAPVFVTRIAANSVSVSSAEPIVVHANDFNLGAGIVKLSEAVNGTPIVTAASITFDLVFETGDKIPQIEASRAAAARQRTAEETSAISTEACETRLGVISTAQAIYFRTASAELDSKSEPLLDSLTDIVNRCPGARIEVSGHTDSVGSKAANQRLSEDRARAVVRYLERKGIPASRIESTGYGDRRPIAPNNTEANRGKNRRIEFRIVNQ